MNEEMLAQLQQQAQGGQPAQGGGQEQAFQMLNEIGQIVTQNNEMLQQIGQMMQEAMGMEASEQGGGAVSEEEALRQEAMARLAQQ
jgi:hypothetical protein